MSMSFLTVGCGASCVYALLGNAINKWKFNVTEIDHTSFQYALKNVELNSMQDDIKGMHDCITNAWRFKQLEFFCLEQIFETY